METLVQDSCVNYATFFRTLCDLLTAYLFILTFELGYEIIVVLSNFTEYSTVYVDSMCIIILHCNFRDEMVK